MKKQLTKKQQKIIAVSIIALAVIIFGIIGVYAGVPMIKFVKDPENFRQWVEARGFFGKIAYVGMVFLQVVAALVPGEPVEIVGGYAFGAFWGTVLCIIGATLGSIAVFALVRGLGIRIVEVFFSREKIRSLKFLQTSPRRTVLFLLIFMLPGTPKDLLCYFAGLTDMKWPLWLIICSLGRIPSVITSTVGGDAVGSQKYLFAVIVFVCTAAVSLGGMVLYGIISKGQNKGKKAN